MADNIFFFKVLAELSDTEYFNFLFFFPLTGGGVRPLVENSTFFLFFWKPCHCFILGNYQFTEIRKQEACVTQEVWSVGLMLCQVHLHLHVMKQSAS